MAFGVGSVRSIFADVSLRDSVTRPLARINRNLGVASLRTGKFTKSIEKNRTELLALGAALTGISAGLTLVLKGTVKTADDFQASMANVSTMLDLNKEGLAALNDEVLDFTKNLPVKPLETTAALYQVLSAGITDTTEAMEFLTVATKTGVAGVTETSVAVNAIISIIKGYGREVEDATDISDKLFKTVKLGQTTFEELASSVGGTVPLAQALGVSLDELLAGYATLTGVTGNTVEVSTQLESILTGLVKPTKDMEKTMKGLGFATSEEMIAELGLVGSLEALLATTDGSSKALGELFERKEGIVSILALMGPQFDTFNEKLKEMENSAGAMGVAYEKNANTFKAFRQTVSNSVFAMSTAIGTELMPVLQEMGKVVGTLANAFTSLPKPLIKIIAVGAGVVAILTGLVGTTLLMAAAVSFALPGLTLLAPAITGIGAAIATAMPWLLVIGAALILLHKAWKSNFLGIRNITSDAWKGIKEVFKALSPFLDALWSTVKDTFNPITQMLKDFGIIGEDTGKGFLDSFKPVIDFLKANEDTFRTFGKIAGWLVTGPIRLLVLGIVVLGKALKAVMDVFGKLKNVTGPLSYLIPGLGPANLARDILGGNVALPTPSELTTPTTTASQTSTTVDNRTSIGQITVKTDDPEKFYNDFVKQARRDEEGS